MVITPNGGRISWFEGMQRTSLGSFLLELLHCRPPSPWKAKSEDHRSHLLHVASSHLSHHLFLVPIDKVSCIMLAGHHRTAKPPAKMM